MNLRRSTLATLLVVLVATSSISAATFVVPDDETFIRKADVIVTGTVIDSHVRYTDRGGIETVYRIAIDELLKGTTSDSILELREWGGVIGSRFMAVSGAPEYEIGKRYLIFMTPFRDGRLTTLDLALGQFRFVEHNGQQILERDRDEILDLSERGEIFIRPATRFLEQIRRQVAEEPELDASKVVVKPRANDLDTATASAIGASAWSGGTTVSYSVSGTPAGGDTLDFDDHEERVIVDDPHGDISGSFNGSGTVATAFWTGFILSDRLDISASDIVVQDGVSSSTLNQSNYNTTITHEMGHTLGFRHSDQNQYSQAGTSCSAPLPCSNGAVMRSSIVGGLNGNLQSWDANAVGSSYGSSPDTDYQIISSSQGDKPWYRSNPSVVWFIAEPAPACTGPSITQQPTATPSTINSGQSSTLSVTASPGTGSISYQWYRGTTGQIGNAVPGGTGSSVMVSPAPGTHNYWVRVTDECSSVDSISVQVQVNDLCGGPTITQQPFANPAQVIQGQSTTLSIGAVASEGTLSVTWYQGAKGNTSNQVGTGTSIAVSPAPAGSYTYWAQVSDTCATGAPVDSNTVTVTVICEPTIVSQPPDRTITAGQSTTLSAAANNATSYTWYVGSAPDTSTPAGNGSSITVSPATTTQYWVRMSNSCGSVNSRTATVTVQECQAPQITVQPASTSVESGQSAVLSVGVTGSTPISITWYRGSAGDTSTQVGTGTSISVSPTSTTQYWAQAANVCGFDNSQAATVTVVGACEQPQITEQPEQGQIIQSGETATLSVVASGTTLAYQWFQVTGTVASEIAGANAPTFTTPPLEASATYFVRVSNGCGSVESIHVIVNVSQCAAPTIVTQPQSMTVRGGTEVVLSVVANGTAPLSYQWYEGTSGQPSIAIPGAISSTLDLGLARESASYWVQVSNSCGSVGSATATVEVEVLRRRTVRRP